VQNAWTLQALDVKTAFLYGNLKEEIYMEQPEGFVKKGRDEKKVYRLLKALYGLKQAALVWNIELHKSLQRLGFNRVVSDAGIYVHQGVTGNKKVKVLLILIIYVDDVLFTGSDQKYLGIMKEKFMKVWECHDLGTAKEYLGMEIQRNPSTGSLIVDQVKYLDKILKRFDMQDCNPANTPLPEKYDPVASTRESNSKLHSQYQSVIGSLLYLMLGTRPDIAFAVIKMSQFSANPTEDHLNHAKYIFCYLRANREYGIEFRRDTSL